MRIVENERKTSRGFLISRDVAKMLTERWFVWRDVPKTTTPTTTPELIATPPGEISALTADDIKW